MDQLADFFFFFIHGKIDTRTLEHTLQQKIQEREAKRCTRENCKQHDLMYSTNYMRK